jgi:hypothetical protein
MNEQLTPKQKAKELIEKFRPNVFETRLTKEFKLINVKLQLAKECAELAVDEIINSVENEHVSDIYENFWQQVKQEIINYQE